jgi:hypothetical protein
MLVLEQAEKSGLRIEPPCQARLVDDGGESRCSTWGLPRDNGRDEAVRDCGDPIPGRLFGPSGTWPVITFYLGVRFNFIEREEIFLPQLKCVDFDRRTSRLQRFEISVGDPDRLRFHATG